MLITVEGIEIEVGNNIYEGTVDCEFIIDHYDAGYIGGLPENCYPAEMECHIDVIGWSFGDEDGEDVEVDRETMEDKIKKLDGDGYFSDEWAKAIESWELDKAIAKAEGMI